MGILVPKQKKEASTPKEKPTIKPKAVGSEAIVLKLPRLVRQLSLSSISDELFEAIEEILSLLKSGLLSTSSISF